MRGVRARLRGRRRDDQDDCRRHHALIFPGADSPHDLDAEGLYDDVNGNGRKDFADVVLYFNQMTWIPTKEPNEAFDYNANGRIDFADVVLLFNFL